MSRYQIPAKDANHTCSVGYDRGLSTFFAQVEDKEAEGVATEAAERVVAAIGVGGEPAEIDVITSRRESLVLWIGASQVGEIQTVEELAERLSPYAEIAPEMIERLRADAAGEEEGPRSALERSVREYIRAGATS